MVLEQAALCLVQHYHQWQFGAVVRRVQLYGRAGFRNRPAYLKRLENSPEA